MNSIISILGKKGSGKSYLAAQIVNRYIEKGKKTIIIDISQDYKKDKKIDIPVFEIERIRENYKKFNFEKYLKDKNNLLLDFSGLRKKEFREIADQVALAIYNIQNCTVLVDESYMFIPKNKENNFELLISGGRKRNIDQIYITQRSQQLNLLVYSQSDIFCCFQLQEDRSIKKIINNFPILNDYKDKIRELEKYKFIETDGKEVNIRKNELLFDN